MKVLWRIGLLTALVITLLVVILSAGLRVSLDHYRGFITSLVSDKLGIELVIDGNIELELSLSPSFSLESIKVPNPKAWPNSHLMVLARLQAKVSLLPLLNNKIVIDYIELEGLKLNVVQSPGEPSNLDLWLKTIQTHTASADSATATNSTAAQQSSVVDSGDEQMWSLAFDYDIDINQHIKALDVAIDYRDTASEAVIDWRLNELSVIANDSNEFVLEAQGSMLGEPYSVSSVWQVNALLQGRKSAMATQVILANGRLDINGEVALDASAQSSLNIELDWPQKESLIRILGPQFEPLSPLSIKGQVLYEPGTIAMPSLKAHLGKATATANLAIKATPDERPHIAGALVVDRIDASHWLQGGSADKAVKLQNQSSSEDKQSTPIVQIMKSWLDRANLDLELVLGQLLGFDLDIEDITLAARVQDGKIEAPSTVTIEGVTFHGEAIGHGSEDYIDAQIRLKTKDANLTPLAKKMNLIVLDGESIELESSELFLQLKGNSLQQWLDQSHLKFYASQGVFAFASGTKMQLQKVEILSDQKDNFRAQIIGDILGIPLNIKMQSPALQKLKNQLWQLDLQVESPAFTLDGEMELPQGDWNNTARFSMSLRSEKLGNLAPWLGINPNLDTPLEVSATYILEPNRFSVDINKLHVGDSEASLNWVLSTQNLIANNADDQVPVSQLDVAFKYLDIDKLLVMLETSSSQTTMSAGANSKKAGTLDLPILPNGLYFGDMDLNLTAQRIVVAQQQLNQVSLSAKSREGWIQRSPFALNYLGSNFEGELAFDLRQSPLQMAIDLQSRKLNLGSALAKLNVVEGLEMGVDKASLKLRLTGDSLKELILSTQFDLTMENGYWVLLDQNTGSTARLDIDKGSLMVSPATALTFNLVGTVQESNYSLALRSLSLSELASQPASLPIALDATLDEVSIQAQAKLARPVRADAIKLNYQLKSPSINSLDHLHGFSLPPFGPLKSSGAFEISKRGYEIEDIRFEVGRSQLQGKALLRTDTPVPELGLELDADYIQLDDFEFGDWRPLAQSIHAPSNTNQDGAVMKKDNDIIDVPIQQTLASLNAEIDVNVDKVELAEDHLGSGILQLRLQDSELSIKRLYVELPGGEIELSASVAPSSVGFDSQLKADIEQFDYGILARHIKPETDMAGLLNLKVDLNSKTQEVYGLLSGASGKLGFAVWPENFEAGLIDLWAVSLVSAMMPKLESDISLLNCAIASFSLEDGVMNQDILMADTSNIRIQGESSIDFKNQTLSLRMAPKPKTAQIFNLQTPIAASGGFEDFKIGVAGGGIVGTTLRFITSPVIAPLSWIFTAPLEADGSQLCRQAWSASTVLD